jgi:hypothetical protein
MEFVGSTQTIFVTTATGRDFRLQRFDLGYAAVLPPVTLTWDPRHALALPNPWEHIMYNEKLMRRAVEFSTLALTQPRTEPFGAVFPKDDKIIGEGLNHSLAHFDPTSRGETEAIRDACRSLKTVDLRGCELYISAMPGGTLSGLAQAQVGHSRGPRLRVRPACVDAARRYADPDSSLPNTAGCGFGALPILPGDYPTGFKRGFGPSVDIWLTRGAKRKKPPLRAARNVLITSQRSGCGGRI